MQIYLFVNFPVESKMRFEFREKYTRVCVCVGKLRADIVYYCDPAVSVIFYIHHGIFCTRTDTNYSRLADMLFWYRILYCNRVCFSTRSIRTTNSRRTARVGIPEFERTIRTIRLGNSRLIFKKNQNLLIFSGTLFEKIS